MHDQVREATKREWMARCDAEYRSLKEAADKAEPQAKAAALAALNERYDILQPMYHQVSGGRQIAQRVAVGCCL